jgi:hypothetical protein
MLPPIGAAPSASMSFDISDASELQGGGGAADIIHAATVGHSGWDSDENRLQSHRDSR